MKVRNADVVLYIFVIGLLASEIIFDISERFPGDWFYFILGMSLFISSIVLFVNRANRTE